jgi:hypothetical protein
MLGVLLDNMSQPVSAAVLRVAIAAKSGKPRGKIPILPTSDVDFVSRAKYLLKNWIETGFGLEDADILLRRSDRGEWTLDRDLLLRLLPHVFDRRSSSPRRLDPFSLPIEQPFQVPAFTVVRGYGSLDCAARFGPAIQEFMRVGGAVQVHLDPSGIDDAIHLAKSWRSLSVLFAVHPVRKDAVAEILRQGWQIGDRRAFTVDLGQTRARGPNPEPIVKLATRHGNVEKVLSDLRSLWCAPHKRRFEEFLVSDEFAEEEARSILERLRLRLLPRHPPSRYENSGKEHML